MKPLETERLILRRWQSEDIDPFVKINQDPKVREFLYPVEQSREDTIDMITRFNKHIDAHGFGLFAIELKSTGELIGFVGLNILDLEADFTPCVEIAWRLSSQYWRKGYATEAAKRTLEFAFQNLNLNNVFAFTSVRNIPSVAVMKKIGMQRVPGGDFHHPKLPVEHPLSLHLLYQANKPN